MTADQRASLVFVVASACVALLSGTTHGNTPPQDPPVYDLVEDLRIVSNDAIPQMSLTTVNGFTVLPDGSIVTGHQTEFLVRVFNPNGSLARTIGHQGQGPGEFQGISRIGSVGDSIWVDDIRSSAINVFSRTGQFIRSVPYPPRGDRPASRAAASAASSVSSIIMGLLPERRLLVIRNHRRPAGATGTLGLSDSTFYLIQDSTFRTVTQLLRTGDIDRPFIRIVATGMSSTIGQPLAGRVDAAVAPGGRFVLASDPSTFNGQPGQLKLTELTGAATVTSRTVQLPPMRVSRNFADSFATAMGKNVDARPPNSTIQRPQRTPAQVQEFEQAIRSQLYVPEFLPVNKQTALGRDGSLWLNYQSDGSTWAVLIDGRVAMRVRVPTDLWVRQVSRDFVWATRTDADGLPIILRYRVVRRS